MTTPQHPLAAHFGDLPDPRLDRTKRHSLLDILAIALAAVICGGDGFAEMEDFGNARLEWFSKFLELPNGIPSHDTFGRVLSMLDPTEFTRCFLAWTSALQEKTEGQIVSLDGKQLRRSFDKASGVPAVTMVSAWCQDNSLVLGQVKVDDKSNEITAIPELLRLLDLAGCTVTIDAAGTQREIAHQIVEQEANYVLAVKLNQPELHADVTAFLDNSIANRWVDYHGEPIEHSHFETRDADHGRIETRRYWCTADLSLVHGKALWSALRSIAVVEAERIVDGKASVHRRYYISSLPPDAKLIAHAIRQHWGIENSLHWVLDMSFREDESRTRRDNAPANMATLRHVAINMLRAEKSIKRSINRKRLLAAWEPWYLERVLIN